MAGKLSLDLTERQEEVLRYIKDYQKLIGYPPTRKEIANHFGFKSHHTSVCHLQALESKNFIRLEPGASRGIQVLK